MSLIDLTKLDSEDEMSSFGSKMTDDGSVVFVAEVSIFSSDCEESEENEEPEEGMC